jgi:hypothetical protein
MQSQKDPDEMLNANDAGKILGVSGKTVVRLMEAGDFRGYKIGNVWKYRRGDIEAYRDASQYQPGKPEQSSEGDSKPERPAA